MSKLQRDRANTMATQPRRAAADCAAPAASGQTTTGDVSETPRQLQQSDRLARLQPKAATPAGNGLPEGLRHGIEALSGYDMSGVRVHRNSSKPAALQAHAYAQGQDIHLGPGQEKHLPHEAWHVVQQAQGRVRPTVQMKAGVPVNDDAGLEREADVMGARAAQLYPQSDQPVAASTAQMTADGSVVQRRVGFEFETGWDLRKPGGMAWDSDTVLVKGLGWQMSPDEISGNEAKIEFKTDAFDVDGAPDAVAEPIAAMFDSMGKYIRARLLPLPQDAYSPLAMALGSANAVEVQPQGALEAKPQVTGGVRTDMLLRFLSDLARGDGEADLMPGEAKKTMLSGVLDRVGVEVDERSKTSREYWGVVALLANLVMRFQADAERATETYREWRQQQRAELERRFEAWEQRVNPDEETRLAKIQEVKDHLAELSATRREEIRAQLAPSYAKARASALPRVAFNELPEVRQGNLLRDVLKAADLAFPADGARKMFPLGMKDDADFQETIAEWIESIQQPVDADDEGELWSARSLGSEPVGPAPTRGLGIPFELRGIPGQLPHDQWPTFSIPFLTYFAQLNQRKR